MISVNSQRKDDPSHKIYHCYKCNINYNTTIGAMKAHAGTHARDDFMKIGVVKDKHPGAGNFRPEEHAWKEASGKTYIGVESRCHKFVVPGSVRNEEGKLFCRGECDFSIDYDEAWSFQKKSKWIDIFRKHEAGCKSRARNLK